MTTFTRAMYFPLPSSLHRRSTEPPSSPSTDPHPQTSPTSISPWSQILDPQTGSFYFYSSHSSATQWHFPFTLAEEEDCWEERDEEIDGRMCSYWYNRKTNRSQWVHPFVGEGEGGWGGGGGGRGEEDEDKDGGSQDDQLQNSPTNLQSSASLRSTRLKSSG